MYKRRSWQSLVDRVPGLAKTFSISRARAGPSDTYRTGTYYGFAADLGQLRLHYNRQSLFIDLDRVVVNNNNNASEGASSQIPKPFSADDTCIPSPTLTSLKTTTSTITISWSQLTKVKRRSAETVEFCFHTANVPPAFFYLVPKLSRPSRNSSSWSISIHFAMGVSEDLLSEMRLMGVVRKVRYGFCRLRKCYVPLPQVSTSTQNKGVFV